ncbi:hypothetical protein [Pontibacter burrus]|uniref:Uncharacterized protein n=1 Tax=Pontibacter burrus TaxID=2704466 RepID=A0A6B3M1G5_9BACT|nr:hypothetical protein [Pontibacter burrus]NEM99431.1 hypothetical protein [Pontibacter burrus]
MKDTACGNPATIVNYKTIATYRTIAKAISIVILSGQLSQETQHHRKSRARTLVPATGNCET